MIRPLPYDQMSVTFEVRSRAQYIELLITVGLFAAVVGSFSLGWFYDFAREGISTVGAERILAGEIPYRDFWTMYAPGQFYLLAVLFKIFGAHLLVEVVASSIVCAAAVCVCYRLVFNLVGRRLAALAPPVILLAAFYNTGYFKRLGSYSPAFLFILLAVNFLLQYCRKGNVRYLLAAGLATGTTLVFKHDVGCYTAIAIMAGFTAHHILTPEPMAGSVSSLGRKLLCYAVGLVAVAVPVLAYFAILAGPDMLKDLVIFPLTDFRFARPEGYPNLFPLGIYNPSFLKMVDNLFTYTNLTVPFIVFLLGLVAIGLALRSGKPHYVAAGVTFSVGYLLHYAAAHVQINTHIITMSVYAACSGVIFYDLLDDESLRQRRASIKLLPPAIILGWLVSLTAKPAFLGWQAWNSATVTLEVPKISGFKASPDEAQILTELSSFVSTHMPEGEPLFVGLHRHDVVIIGDVMIYFILNHPSATRYQELHPAIADTAAVQNEIVADLQEKNSSYIILKHIFPDEGLEREKQNFLRHLPQIGATQLDEFIRANYVQVRTFGPYAIWQKTGVGSGRAFSSSPEFAVKNKSYF